MGTKRSKKWVVLKVSLQAEKYKVGWNAKYGSVFLLIKHTTASTSSMEADETKIFKRTHGQFSYLSFDSEQKWGFCIKCVMRGLLSGLSSFVHQASTRQSATRWVGVGLVSAWWDEGERASLKCCRYFASYRKLMLQYHGDEGTATESK
jgi:hypothetical protein